MERAELSRLLGGVSVSSRAAPVCVTESDGEIFKLAFASAVAGRGEVFLGNPAWGRVERAQVDTLLRTPASGQGPANGRGWLMIPTGGTSGQIRFARHDGDTISAAVGGFRQHFRVERVNALTLGFSLRATAGRTVNPLMPTMRSCSPSA